MAPSFVARALDAYASVQVELQGQYSIRRLRQLVHFAHTTPSLRAVAIALATPLPCIVLVVGTDLVRLSPLEHGENLAFWTRTFFSVLTITVGSLIQISHASASLRFSPRQLAFVSIALTLLDCTNVAVLSRVIGFPVPFSVQAVTPLWLTGLSFSLWSIWKHELRVNEDARLGLLQYAWHCVCLPTMVIVYPSLRFVFGIAGDYGKMAITLVLPFLKLAFRNWSSYGAYRVEDLAPAVVSFSVDVFHALFLSSIMQGPTSSGNLLVTMVIDFLQGCVSVYEVIKVMRAAASAAIQIQTMETASSGAGPRLLAPVMQPRSVVHEAVKILDAHPHVVERCPSIALARHLRPIATLARRATVRTTRIAAAPMLRVVPQGPIKAVPGVLSSQNALLLSPCDQSRAAYVRQTLHVLHMVEFYLLIEFTEIIIALIYSVYLAAMSQLPNRRYYLQLRTMTDAELAVALHNVLTYAALELLSFLLLTAVLTKLLGFPAFRILAFALQQQWVIVQSQLVIWVCLVIQISIEHFGNDYTFQFKWLHQQ